MNYRSWSVVKLRELHDWQQQRIKLYKALVALGTHEQKAAEFGTTVHNLRTLLWRAGIRFGEKCEGGVYANIRQQNLDRVRRSLEDCGHYEDVTK